MTVFLTCWVAVYTGLAHTTIIDHESSFNSFEFRRNAKEVGVTLQFSSIESNNAIGQK